MNNIVKVFRELDNPEYVIKNGELVNPDRYEANGISYNEDKQFNCTSYNSETKIKLTDTGLKLEMSLSVDRDTADKIITTFSAYASILPHSSLRNCLKLLYQVLNTSMKLK